MKTIVSIFLSIFAICLFPIVVLGFVWGIAKDCFSGGTELADATPQRIQDWLDAE